MSLITDLLLLLLCSTRIGTTIAVGPRNNYGIKPPPKQDVYEYWLEVHMGLTMASVVYENFNQQLSYNLTNQEYYIIDDSSKTACGVLLPTPSNFTTNQIPTADGLHKHFTAVNGSLPAPQIVVYQNSTIVVHVTNYLLSPISIHFHGLTFRNQFYMDGAGIVTQCPINHGETFTYRFQVTDTPGTYWYHGHDGAHLGEGLYGAFIVLDPNEGEPESSDFISVLSDWYPNNTEVLFWVDRQGHNKYLYGYDRTDKCYYKSNNAQGFRAATKPLYSVLINGKGWHNTDELDRFLTQLPVERFIIDLNRNSTRVRLINAAFKQSFYVHIDGHDLELIASDGVQIQSKAIDGVYICPGERYDLRLIRKNFAQQHFKFWVESTDKLDQRNQRNDQEYLKHHMLGIISYADGPLLDLIPDQNKACNPCTILNCPFAEHPSPKFHCIHLTKLQAKMPGPSDILNAEKVVHKFFHFQSENGIYSERVNGIQFMMPHYPPFMHTGNLDHAITRCAIDCGIHNAKCHCTSIVELELGQVYQFTIYSLFFSDGDAKTFKVHPFHLHGQHFYIMKQGFAIQSPDTGLAINRTKDITCNNSYDCNYGTYADDTWLTALPSNGNANPIAKDTVMIPTGGYVIVRFKAENPGWWLGHCHLLKHHLNGMAVLFKVGTDAQTPEPPDDFPVCGFRMGQIKC